MTPIHLYLGELLLLLAIFLPASSTLNVDTILQRPAVNYRPSTPRRVLNRARGYTGDDTRLRAFVDKLIEGMHMWSTSAPGSAGCVRALHPRLPDCHAGKPVKYAVIGSSIATQRGSKQRDGSWWVMSHGEFMMDLRGGCYPWQPAPSTRHVHRTFFFGTIR